MRQTQKEQINEIINLMGQVHVEIVNAYNDADLNTACELLASCQETAIELGTNIENIEGENCETVRLLEGYCEAVFAVHETLVSGTYIGDAWNDLMDRYDAICVSFAAIPLTKEVVFLPYKASMWDSLESVWRKYDADPEWKAVVMPIPYYDKNPDGSFKEFHYEIDSYPDYVPVTHYEKYNLEVNHPDEIYIHNPYDEYNFVTSVHPFFFSSNIKKFTDKLVYIPYFVLSERNHNSMGAVESVAHFAQTAGVVNADKVIVQSEEMKLCYVEALVQMFGEKTRNQWMNKIEGSGSPKIERLLNLTRDELQIPEEWKGKLYRTDGALKKVVLYNTSVSALLHEDEKMVDKIMRVIDIFNEHSEDIVLLWRPHPLIEATISSMRPELWASYKKVVERFKTEDIGIYDDSSDLDRAIVLADAYYGDGSSLVQLCQAVKIPVMIQNVNV